MRCLCWSTESDRTGRPGGRAG
uniref:Uncharacterized protein n=1 Tax=Arundo donax TaxID=35708 RepID=A0A0A8Z5V9_ARUDO